MTDEESKALNEGKKFRCVGKTLVFLPGGFKPPHKGHWVMVTDSMDTADEIHIFISKDVRSSSDGKFIITAETSEKIFNIYAREYGIYDKVVTHICNNPSPIISAVGFGNHQCQDCDIYIGSTTSDEAAERDAGWNGVMKNFRYNRTNRIHRLPEAPKIQAARDIRDNMNNLTKDMFPPEISDEAFNEIKKLLNPTKVTESKRFISKFNVLFESVMKSLIEESGIAVKDIKPIYRENIQPTIDNFYDEILKPIGIRASALHTVGSTGKKDVSGDLDLALDLNDALSSSGLADVFEIADRIGEKCSEHGYQFSNALNGKFKTLHVGYPIVNQDGIAQIDIMPTQNISYTKFKLNAPGKGESNYKGVHRSDMLKSLIKICSISADKNASAEDSVEYVDKKGIKYPGIQFIQYSLEPEGLEKVVKTFRGKKGNLVSEPRTISKEIVKSDPIDILNGFFGDLYQESDFNSFESIWNNVIFDERFPYKDRIDDIVNDFVKRFNGDMSWQLDSHKEQLPKEVEEYLR